MDTIHVHTTVLVQSFSNFTCKLLMMRGETLLILDRRVKCHFQSLSNFTCTLWMMRGGTLLIFGHRVKVNPPPCEGMPRFVLSSFILYFTFASCPLQPEQALANEINRDINLANTLFKIKIQRTKIWWQFPIVYNLLCQR